MFSDNTSQPRLSLHFTVILFFPLCRALRQGFCFPAQPENDANCTQMVLNVHTENTVTVLHVVHAWNGLTQTSRWSQLSHNWIYLDSFYFFLTRVREQNFPLRLTNTYGFIKLCNRKNFQKHIFFLMTLNYLNARSSFLIMLKSGKSREISFLCEQITCKKKTKTHLFPKPDAASLSVSTTTAVNTH